MTGIVLELREIDKSFPGVKALDHLSVQFRRGEVHALVGENGAGKSTLMKVVVGAYQADSGEMTWKGEPAHFRTPHDAQLAGISMIYQERNLVPFMTAAENIFLGREPQTAQGLLDSARMEEESRQLLHRLELDLDVRLPVRHLSVAQQQFVEIAKALSFDADLIIMDEPSAALTGSELERLFATIATLKQHGVTIIYVSHRLEEIFSIADRVTVLRDGIWINTVPVSETNREGLVRMMVGRTLTETFPEKATSEGEPVLRVEGLTRRGVLRDIHFTLHRGEILGVAGLVGSGRTQLARALFGADPVTSGEIHVSGQRVAIHGPRDAMRAGLGFLTEDRKAEGLALWLSLRQNVALPSLDRRSLFGLVRERAEKAAVESSVHDLRIRARSIEQQVRYLSGGNQQKVALAKWLNTEPQVIIFDEPTRGIDVGAKAEIYGLMRHMANTGKAILMISSDLPEVLGMSDRVMVMREGSIVGTLTKDEATEERILSLGCGVTGEACPVPAAGQLAGTQQPVVRHLRWRVQRPMAVSAYIIVLLLMLIGAIFSPTFRTSLNAQNLVRQVVGIGLVTIGQTFAVLAGGSDLSLDAIVILVAVFAASFMNGRTEMILPVVLFCLGLGAFIGWLNGLAIVKLRVPSFAATLGMAAIGGGVALVYTSVPIGRVAQPFRFLAGGQIGPIPFPLVFFALILGAVSLLLRKTPFGRHIYAVGGDKEVARLSGINVQRVEILAYVLCGLATAVGGLYFASRMGVGDPNSTASLAFDSLIAVVIGGCRLGGGLGSVEGALGGVLVVSLLNNVLNMLNVNAWYQQILKGIIILAAVSLFPEKK